MQLALSLLISAFQLLTLVAHTPNLPPSFVNQAIQISNTAITVAQTELAKIPSEDGVVIPVITTPVITGSTQSSGVPQNPLPNTQIGSTMNTMEELQCTLTAQSNVAPATGNARLTWTSNADSATLVNSRMSGVYTINKDGKHPVTGATQEFPMSGEAGENNIFTMTFVKGDQTKDCSVSVMTQ